MAININDIDKLIASIINNNKRASKERRGVLFNDIMRRPEYEEYLEYGLRYLFGLRYGKAERMTRPYTDADEAYRREAIRKREIELTEESQLKADTYYRESYEFYNLMDQIIQPYGKPLRMCTVSELRKVGGWLISACKGHEETEMAGDIFTNNYLREIWDNHKNGGSSPETHPIQ